MGYNPTAGRIALSSATKMGGEVGETQKGNTFVSPSIGKRLRAQKSPAGGKPLCKRVAGLARYAIGAGIIESSVRLTIV